MHAVPTRLGPEEQVTGLSCPDCSGVLNVSAHGQRGTLHFRCRVGHAYAVDDVIVGKEKKLEEYLWSTVATIAELVALLHELIAMGKTGSQTEAYAERAARAMRHE